MYNGNRNYLTFDTATLHTCLRELWRTAKKKKKTDSILCPIFIDNSRTSVLKVVLLPSIFSTIIIGMLDNYLLMPNRKRTHLDFWFPALLPFLLLVDHCNLSLCGCLLETGVAGQPVTNMPIGLKL